MEYELIGDNSQAIHITLKRGEAIIIRKGSLIYITPEIEIKPIPEDKLFMGITPLATPTLVGIGLDDSGKITPVKLYPGAPLIVRRKNLLLYNPKIEKNKIYSLNVGEKIYDLLLLHSKYSEETIFVSYKGDFIQLELADGQTLYIDPENFVMAEYSVGISYVDKFKFTLLGEEPRLIKVSGPGKVWLQTITPWV